MPHTNSKNGTHDRIRNRGRLDQVFLGHLCAEVTAREHAVGADNRQSHMMADTSGGFCDTPIPAFFGIPDSTTT
jgi:hypothetical protein